MAMAVFPRSTRVLVALCAGALLLVVALVSPARAQAPTSNDAGWQPLFDGKTLTNWKPTKFYGEGPVKVE
ncbi:MAG: hypothetical protein ACREUZ_16905, partial [Burkholderiales bacterium]